MTQTVANMLKVLGRFFKVFGTVHLGVGQFGLRQAKGTAVDLIHKTVGVDERKPVTFARKLLLSKPGVGVDFSVILKDIVVLVQGVDEAVHEVVHGDLLRVVFAATTHADRFQGRHVGTLGNTLKAKAINDRPILDIVGRPQAELGVELGRGVDAVGGVGGQTEHGVGGGPALRTVGVVVVGAGGGVRLVGLLQRLARQVAADKRVVGREDPVVLSVGALATVAFHLPGVRALSIEEVGAVGVGGALRGAHVVPHVPVRHALAVAPQARVLRVAVVLLQGEGRKGRVRLDVVADGGVHAQRVSHLPLHRAVRPLFVAILFIPYCTSRTYGHHKGQHV